ncbi:unnamed protein product [Echinostoma caproni]|uniref:CUB domain-containing protein n=1 Tax=Echinostoma caproni TaxID=27848 RepID=A0A183A9N9_9TREM|nr:unnamed protein product [Echinostoma caproni]
MNIGDKCGGVWEAGGAYMCNDCVRRYIAPSTCTYILNSYTAGAPSLQLNITKLGKGDGSDVVLRVFDGARGRNTLLETINKNHTKLYTPVGSTIIIELRLLTMPIPEVSFSFLFQTSGCGGVILDSGFIFNPGYPDGINDEDNCVWIFYASSGLSPSIEILRSELSDSSGVCADVEVRDGESGVHPMIALLNGTDIRRYKGSSRNLWIRYTSYKSSHSYGFVGRLTSVA